ncbi:hypothetical protein [Tepidibacter sp. Z1-5]|uniref:hypothetical protein n=1 Tax=Tepidibacter sp. Z1-5 TaxID=3134138 RepID=UPI0030C3661F
MKVLKDIFKSFNKENINIFIRSFIDPSVYIQASNKTKEDLKSYLYFTICIIFFMNYLLKIGNVNINTNVTLELIFEVIINFLLAFLFIPIFIWINSLFIYWVKNKNINRYTFEQIENMTMVSTLARFLVTNFIIRIFNINNMGIFTSLAIFLVMYIGFLNIMIMMYHKNNRIEEL